MKTFRVKITERFAYEIDVEANSQKEALEKAKEYYKNANDGYVGVADGDSYESTSFKLLKNA